MRRHSGLVIGPGEGDRPSFYLVRRGGAVNWLFRRPVQVVTILFRAFDTVDRCCHALRRQHSLEVC